MASEDWDKIVKFREFSCNLVDRFVLKVGQFEERNLLLQLSILLQSCKGETPKQKLHFSKLPFTK